MNRAWLPIFLLLVLADGCSKPKPPGKPPIDLDPMVKVVHPELRNIQRIVEQPGTIQAYERTAMYTKVSGYVKKWNVDIGKPMEKGGVLVELTAPWLVEQYEGMKAQVKLDQVMVEQSRTLVDVAASNVVSASEMVAQASADVKRYQADVQRWESEVTRMTSLVKETVVTQQNLDETQRQLSSSRSALEASRTVVKTRESQVLAAKANLEKSKVDVTAAEAKVQVSTAEERRLAALVGYLKVVAPYDGVVFARNVNTGDFVLPESGDATLGSLSEGVSSNRSTPLYVFVRRDPVLFVVGVPEADAPYIDAKIEPEVRVGLAFMGGGGLMSPDLFAGTKAKVRVSAMKGGADRDFEVRVTRTSWALNTTSRTLIVQIELPNPKLELVPGNYAYGSVYINRTDVRAVPLSSITQIGNQMCCYLVVDGKAVRTSVQTGVSDGTLIEVTKKLVPSNGSAEGNWQPFDGKEWVIEGDLSEISNGKAVKVDGGS